ncbi:undecaprenyl-diphosphate phosphatase [Candidatus Micrarchaeota archaeon]|nr:undecaprenyl-diphosphate phosphatase [Candidatus Micrarchaeota archaeon]
MLEYILLGILQGVTEWLPVSSKSQVMLSAVSFLGLNGLDALKLSLLLHAGTALAAVAYYRKTLWKLFLELGDVKKTSHTFRFLFTSTAVTAAVALPLYLAYRGSFDVNNARILTALIGLGLLATALLLHVKPKGLRKENELTWKDAAFAGLLQAFSVLPGISRSGTSTAALLWRNVSQDEALRLSFLMSIPMVAAAQIAFFFIEGLPAIGWTQALVMVASSFVAGYFSIEALLRIARHVSFAWFCAGLGLVALAGAFL